MQFQPHSRTHAVENAVIHVVFENSVSSTAIVRSAFAADEPWRADLPGIRDLQGFAIQMQQGRPEGAVAITGTEFLLFQPDGTPAWLLRFAPDHIAVECHIYTRWPQVWAAAGKYIGSALSHLAKVGSGVAIAKVVLQVTDRFVAKGSSYQASELLQPSNKLASTFLDQSGAWHSHSGWYEQTVQGRVLHNLNVDALPDPIVDDDQRAEGWQIRLLHFQRLHLLAPAAITTDDANNIALVATSAATMHDRNKVMLEELLTATAQEAIHLRDKS